MTSDAQRAADLLGDANTRLVRTVDGLHDDDWGAPSALPGWTRAHVVSHLALNAEGLARCLHGLVSDEEGEPGTMYDSDEQRDSDIAELAQAAPFEIRERLMAGITVLNDAIAAVPPEGWTGHVERTPGGRTFPTSAIPGMRLREVEIHHADLAAGYTPAEWSPDFSELLLDAMDARAASGPAFEVKPLDSPRTWLFGDQEGDAEYPVPVVTGPASALGWWLTGRPAPESVSCSQGELPRIGGW